MGKSKSPNQNYTDAVEVIGELKGRFNNDRKALALLKKLEKSCRLYFEEQTQDASPTESQEKQNKYRYQIVYILQKLEQLVELHWDDIKELAHKVAEFFF